MPRSLDYPLVPAGSVLRAAVRRWGDKTAFVHHDVPLTFTELGRRAHAVASWLAERGIGRRNNILTVLASLVEDTEADPADAGVDAAAQLASDSAKRAS